MSEIDTSRPAVGHLLDAIRWNIPLPDTQDWASTVDETEEMLRALLTRAETAERERNEAREEAEAREAVLREALGFYFGPHKNPNDGPWGAASRDFGNVAATALTSTTDAAAARDARVRQQGYRQGYQSGLLEGRREGIEEAARVCDRLVVPDITQSISPGLRDKTVVFRCATAIRALLDKPANGGADE